MHLLVGCLVKYIIANQNHKINIKSHHDNIICLPREPMGRLFQPLDARKEAGAMVTYSDLIQFVIMLCAVITLVIYCIRKK